MVWEYLQNKTNQSNISRFQQIISFLILIIEGEINSDFFANQEFIIHYVNLMYF